MLHFSPEDRRIWFLIAIIAVLAGLFVPFSQAVLDVEYDYTLRVVALGGSVLGVVSGILGSFAVLRHQSLMGDALSHAALPGVGIAFLLAGRDLEVLLIGAGIASWLGVQFIQFLIHTTRIKQDTAMGIVLAAWFAIGIAVLTYIQAGPDASQAGLDTFIFGQAAAIVRRDVEMIALVGLVALAVMALFWKEFKLITFDPEFAGANGFRVTILNAILSTLVVVAIVLGLQLAGVVLMVGMLIAPGIAARQWTHKLDQMVILSGVLGAVAGGTGAIASAVDTDIPTGPMIIVVAFSIVMISLAFAPGRGLIWTLLRQLQDHSRFAAQNVLRDIYSYAQSRGDPSQPVPAAIIGGGRRLSVQRGLKQLQKQGLVYQEGNSWALTSAGSELAARDAYSQQLWEAYRLYGNELSLPAVAEDRHKDIRQILPQSAIRQLEQVLKGADS